MTTLHNNDDWLEQDGSLNELQELLADWAADAAVPAAPRFVPLRAPPPVSATATCACGGCVLCRTAALSAKAALLPAGGNGAWLASMTALDARIPRLPGAATAVAAGPQLKAAAPRRRPVQRRSVLKTLPAASTMTLAEIRAECGMIEPGAEPSAARKAVLARWRAKRATLNFTRQRKHSYKGRARVAATRERVGGRFKKSEPVVCAADFPEAIEDVFATAMVVV